MTTATYTVSGMTCDHCVMSVTEAIYAMGGVDRVELDLPTGALTLHSEGEIDRATIAAAVTEAGYELVP